WPPARTSIGPKRRISRPDASAAGASLPESRSAVVGSALDPRDVPLPSGGQYARGQPVSCLRGRCSVFGFSSGECEMRIRSRTRKRESTRRREEKEIKLLNAVGRGPADRQQQSALVYSPSKILSRVRVLSRLRVLYPNAERRSLRRAHPGEDARRVGNRVGSEVAKEEGHVQRVLVLQRAGQVHVGAVQ